MSLQKNRYSYIIVILICLSLFSTQIIQPINALTILTTDNFNDNNLDLTRWNKFGYSEWGTFTIQEKHSRLELNITANSGFCGIQSRNIEDISELDIQVNATLFNGFEDIGLYISTLVFDNITTPYNIMVDGYRMILNRDGNYYIQRKLSNSWSTLAQASYNAVLPNELRIRVTGAYIYFNVNKQEIYNQVYALPVPNVYIALITTSGTEDSGGNAFDNFIDNNYVPPQKYLTVQSNISATSFLLNGTSHNTTYTNNMSSATLLFPATFQRANILYTFEKWNDTSNTNPYRVITLTQNTTLLVLYTFELLTLPSGEIGNTILIMCLFFICLAVVGIITRISIIGIIATVSSIILLTGTINENYETMLLSFITILINALFSFIAFSRTR